MKCDYHSEYDAVSTCSQCGQPICVMCEYIKEPKPWCITCYEKYISNLQKIEYKSNTVEVGKKAIVVLVVVIIGTGLFAWGTTIECSGLMIVGVILLAVSILGLRLYKWDRQWRQRELRID